MTANRKPSPAGAIFGFFAVLLLVAICIAAPLGFVDTTIATGLVKFDYVESPVVQLTPSPIPDGVSFGRRPVATPASMSTPSPGTEEIGAPRFVADSGTWSWEGRPYPIRTSSPTPTAVSSPVSDSAEARLEHGLDSWRLRPHYKKPPFLSTSAVVAPVPSSSSNETLSDGFWRQRPHLIEKPSPSNTLNGSFWRQRPHLVEEPSPSITNATAPMTSMTLASEEEPPFPTELLMPPPPFESLGNTPA